MASITARCKKWQPHHPGVSDSELRSRSAYLGRSSGLPVLVGSSRSRLAVLLRFQTDATFSKPLGQSGLSSVPEQITSGAALLHLETDRSCSLSEFAPGQLAIRWTDN